MKRILATALLLTGCATPLSQTPSPGMPNAIPAPEIKVGDTWVYRVHDGFTRIPRGEQRHEVIEVSADRVRVAGDVERGDGIQVYDRQWNWLRRPATNLQTFEYSPAYRAFDFPLAPGKRWRAQVTATDPTDGRRFSVWIDGVVAGWERVKVPAGEFDALRVERTVFFDYWEFSVRGRSEIRETEWYMPAVKQSVRREARSRYLSYLYGGSGGGGVFGFRRARDGRSDGGGPRFVEDDWFVYELASYSVR